MINMTENENTIGISHDDLELIEHNSPKLIINDREITDVEKVVGPDDGDSL